MRAVIVSVVILLMGCDAQAFEVEDQKIFGEQGDGLVLRIISTADINYFAPIINTFRATRPDIKIDYTVASSTQVMQAIYSEKQPFDLVISSAMDLQIKLANDGFARKHTSTFSQNLPNWAIWNDMVFAFTQEPAGIVISNKLFKGRAIPKNRQELINTLRQSPKRFEGRVGTYDIRKSGVGYLFATQDARASDTYWRLTEVMGTLDPKLYCCASDMINDVVNGTLAIAYNVLASYAEKSPQAGEFTIVLPSDFSTVMLRTMIIPTTSENPELATRFLNYVLSQTHPAETAKMLQTKSLRQAEQSTLSRISLGPGLLVYLDYFKKKHFMDEWKNAILQ